jgi:hypothetical protein
VVNLAFVNLTTSAKAGVKYFSVFWWTILTVSVGHGFRRGFRLDLYFVLGQMFSVVYLHQTFRATAAFQFVVFEKQNFLLSGRFRCEITG